MARDEREAQQIDRLTHFYHGKQSIHVVREVYAKDGRYVLTDQFNIPYAMLEAALAQHRAKGDPHVTA